MTGSAVRTLAATESDGKMSGVKVGLLVSGMVVLGCFVALLFIEGVFRVLSIGAHSVSRWSDRPEFYYKDQRAATFQGEGYTPAKPPGVYRIAVIGDSFTFATSMQFDDSFPERLERMLNLNKESRELQVINYGVPGFSTSHEIEAAERAVQESADLIILQITLNDPQIKHARPGGISGKNEFSEFQFSQDSNWLVKHSHLLQFVQRRLHNQRTQDAYIKYYFDLFDSKRSWEQFAKSLLAIKKTAVRNDVGIAAVVFPLFGLPLNEEYPFHPLHEKVSKRLARRGVPVIDLYDSFKGLPLERIQVDPGVDFHPNEIAHRIAAEKIYSWLVESELIPEEFAIQERYRQRLHVRPERNSRL